MITESERMRDVSERKPGMPWTHKQLASPETNPSLDESTTRYVRDMRAVKPAGRTEAGDLYTHTHTRKQLTILPSVPPPIQISSFLMRAFPADRKTMQRYLTDITFKTLKFTQMHHWFID